MYTETSLVHNRKHCLQNANIIGPYIFKVLGKAFRTVENWVQTLIRLLISVAFQFFIICVRATLSSVLSGITLISRPNGSSSSGSRKSLDAGSKESRALARAAFLPQKRESNSAMTQSNKDSMRRLHSLRSSNAVDCAFLRCAGPSTTKSANAAGVVVGRTLLTEACSCGIPNHKRLLLLTTSLRVRVCGEL